MSKAHQAFLDAPPDRALYIDEIDKVIHLPDDVEVIKVMLTYTCGDDGPCPLSPVYILQRGDVVVGVDGLGRVFVDQLGSDPHAFDFLNED